ncbi:MAG: peptidase, partial [Dokdonella sp.]
MKSYSLKPLLLVIAVSAALAACAEKPVETQVTAPTAPAPETAVARVPAVAAFDPGAIDTSINACEDFNGFVNAQWIAANPIPADRTRWGSFDVLLEQSLDRQKALVEAAAAQSDGASASTEQLIGALYRSGMDEAAIEKAGFEPLKPELARIDALASARDIVAYLVDSFTRGQASVFAFGAEADFKNSSRRIAYAFQGGLGLPTPDYYSNPDNAAVRDAYLAHIARVLELIGVAPADAKLQADKVL